MSKSSDTFSRFTRAIVRPPARNFADGLTTVDLGTPDVDLALEQHAAYCAALVKYGCAVVTLPADKRFPDSTFVEDTALMIPNRGAILTRPGAYSRMGEIDAIRGAVTTWYATPAQIIAPGTLDAGDVCESHNHVFIGLSHRTNEEGAHQLTAWLATLGISASTIDIRNVPGILHLKSGVTAVDGRQLLAIRALAKHPAFSGYELLVVPDGEEYAANCIRVNDVVFVADGYSGTHRMLRDAGFALETLGMSEFARMDGGLSCLSLRS